MDILKLLPEDIKKKIFLYLSHPCADMIKNRIAELKLDRIIYFNSGIGLGLDGFEYNMRDLFYTEHFVKLKCDEQTRLWKYNFIHPDVIVESLLNNDYTTTSSDEEFY